MKTTVMIDRDEDGVLELDVDCAFGRSGFEYGIDEARINGDKISRDKVELTAGEETRLRNHCVEIILSSRE